MPTSNTKPKRERIFLRGAFTFAFRSFLGSVGALNVMLVSEQWPGNNPASKIESFHTEPGKTEREGRPCLNLMPGLPRWMA